MRTSSEDVYVKDTNACLTPGKGLTYLCNTIDPFLVLPLAISSAKHSVLLSSSVSDAYVPL